MDHEQSGQTLLIVDDEAGVIHAFCEALEDCGHRVLTTTNPHQALEILSSSQPLDLIVIDLFMPAMDGATLLKKCRQVRPGLKAILTSGIASETELRRWRARGEVIVPKPWRDAELRNAVTRVISGRRSATLVR